MFINYFLISHHTNVLKILSTKENNMKKVDELKESINQLNQTKLKIENEILQVKKQRDDVKSILMTKKTVFEPSKDDLEYIEV